MTETLTYSGLEYYLTGDTAGNNIWLDLVNEILEYADQAIGRAYAGSSILFPQAQDYLVLPNIRKPGTISKVFFWTDAGTLTAQAKIGSTLVTDGEVNATTSKQSNTPSGNKTFAADDDIKIAVSSVSGAGALYWAMYLDITGAGDA